MMNVLGLSLLLTSLAAAGIFSPSPNTNTEKQAAATIVREGHRVVVVEYDQDGLHNTKISISPPSEQRDTNNLDSGVLNNAKDKIKEAASVLPNMGQGISQMNPQDNNPAFLHAPKELICDAYGKCKHKIADAMGKAKDKAQETLDKQKDFINSNREAVSDTIDKARETVYDKARDAREYTMESVENAKEHVVQNVSDARDTLLNVKDSAKRVLGSMVRLDSLMGVANLLGFATAYGMCMWVTFISSDVLSRAMPRQQFAVAQSKIYPVYFRAMAYSIGVALLGHVLTHRKGLFSNMADNFQAYNLLGSLLAVFVNSLYLEPRATKLMFERMKIEKEEGRGREDISGERGNRREEHEHTGTDPKEASTTGQGTEHDAVRARIIKLNDKLKRLNSQSSLLNIFNLMSLTWHLVYLAQRLHRTC